MASSDSCWFGKEDCSKTMTRRNVLLAAIAIAIAPVASYQPRPLLSQRLARTNEKPHHVSTDPFGRIGTFFKPPSPLKMGIMEDFLSGADASKREADNKRYLDSLQQRVDRVNALESDIEDLGDDELEAKTVEFQQRLKDGEDINGKLLEEAFAVVREAAW